MSGIGGHHSTHAQTHDWITPKHILTALGNGIGLLFGRTETGMFMQHIWKKADAILFLYGRLTFHRPDGSKAKGNSGGPSVLIAYGDNNVKALKNCGLPGAFVTQWDCLEGEDNDAKSHI